MSLIDCLRRQIMMNADLEKCKVIIDLARLTSRIVHHFLDQCCLKQIPIIIRFCFKIIRTSACFALKMQECKKVIY